MTTSSREPAVPSAACGYCERPRPLAMLEPCCGRPEHARRLVCANSHDCLGVILGLLHESEQRLAKPVPAASPEPKGRRLCAHADDDGQGMHFLEPGEVCTSGSTASGEAELQARLTAARAVLADFVRWDAGEVIRVNGAGDYEAWADRLATHLGWVLEAVSR